jgi:hypothetical protein
LNARKKLFPELDGPREKLFENSDFDFTTAFLMLVKSKTIRSIFEF